jgi:hypothetical protein
MLATFYKSYGTDNEMQTEDAPLDEDYYLQYYWLIVRILIRIGSLNIFMTNLKYLLDTHFRRLLF